MKSKKMLALSIGLIMTTSLFTGCSTDGLALMNAYSKSQTINSRQTQTDISLKVSGSNMSKQEEQMMGTMLPMINGSKISVLTKTNQNEDKTISKMQSDINLQLGQSADPINMSVWADVNVAGDQPVINEVYKVPKLLSAQLPTDLQGKDYMVMNLANMTNTPATPQIDYKKLMAFSKEFQPKLADFIVKYAKQFNPTTKYITYIGSQSFLQDNEMQSSNTYELKLNDKSFKDLMHYSLNNLAQSTDAMNFIQEYMTSIMSVYDMTNVDKSSRDEITKAFDNIATQLPQNLISINKSLESIDNLKILGDKGITIRYTVNKAGYIINEKGNAEFVVDLPSIIKLSAATGVSNNPSNPTGIYTIGMDFNTDVTNINKDIDIVLPKLNSSNSFNYNDLLKRSNIELPAK